MSKKNKKFFSSELIYSDVNFFVKILILFVIFIVVPFQANATVAIISEPGPSTGTLPRFQCKFETESNFDSATDSVKVTLYDGGSTTSGNVTKTGPAKPIYGLTQRVITCSENIIEYIAANGQKLIKPLKDITIYTLTIFLAWMGYRVVLGDLRELRAETMITIFTILMVASFTYLGASAPYLEYLRKGQLAMTDIAASAIGSKIVLPDGSTANAPCAYQPGTAPLTPYPTIWKRLDCNIAEYLGFTRISGASDIDNDPAIAPFEDFTRLNLMGIKILTASIFEDAGLIMLILFVFIIIAMILSFGNLLIVTVGAMFMLAFLGFLSPVIIPLYLFKTTRGIFNRWVQNMLGYALQPFIIAIYIAFVTHAFSYFLSVGMPADDGSLAATSTPGKPPGFTGGLLDIYSGTYNLVEEYVASGCVSTQSGGSSTGFTGDPSLCGTATPPSEVGLSSFGSKSGLSISSLSAVSIPGIPGADLSKHLLWILTSLAIFMAIVFSFMMNVIEMGNRIVGVSGRTYVTFSQMLGRAQGLVGLKGR